MKLSKLEASNSEYEDVLIVIWLSHSVFGAETPSTEIISREFIFMKISKLEESNSDSEEDALIELDDSVPGEVSGEFIYG